MSDTTSTELLLQQLLRDNHELKQQQRRFEAKLQTLIHMNQVRLLRLITWSNMAGWRFICMPVYTPFVEATAAALWR